MQSVVKRIENLFFGDSFMRRNKAQNRVERSNSEKCVIGHRNTLIPRRFSLQNDMTARLMNCFIAPVFAKTLHQFRTREIPWQFHAGRSGKGETLIPHQMQTDRFRHRIRCVEKIPLYRIGHRFTMSKPIITLRNNRFR
jgi:hypothetical protein